MRRNHWYHRNSRALVFNDWVSGNILPSPIVANPLLTGLISQWTMNGSSGTSEADTIGANTLVSSGTGTVGSQAGVVGTARVWDTTTDARMQVNTTTAFNVFPFSVSTWIKTTDTSFVIFDYLDTATFYGFRLRFSSVSNTLSCSYYKDDSNFIDDSVPSIIIRDGAWHHVATVLSTAGIKLYIDGVLKTTLGWIGTPGAAVINQPFMFGGKVTDGASARYTGSYDVTKIWNANLSQALITADYNSGAGVEL